jgi:hypothetical protein
MQLGPLRVGRVGTVIDDGRSIACPRGVRRLGDVRPDDFNVIGEVGSTGSIRGSHPVPSVREMTNHGEPERTGA